MSAARLARGLLALALVAVLGGATAAGASATSRPEAASGAAPQGEAGLPGYCGLVRGIRCRVVDVPLDRSGGVAGTVHLYVEATAAAGDPKGAILFLAGGPGQSTSELGLFELALSFSTLPYDLVLLDQRGTGRSGPLACPALGPRASVPTIGAAVAACAEELGPARAFYRTLDSVADIEAVRESFGYERLTLAGVSYGTFVAQAYARLHPDRVDRLILDSVVDPAADAFDLSRFAALRRVVREVCARGACRDVTADPLGDLGRLARRLERAPISASVPDSRGRPVRVTLGSAAELLDLLLSADVAPFLWAAVPGAVQAALHDDPAPLLRLAAQEGLVLPAPAELSVPLFVATSCSDARLPWTAGQTLAERRQALEQAIAAVPPAAYAPFPAAVLRDGPAAQLCLRWPDAPGPGLPDAPLPDVPTLVLAGRWDLRTPIESALAVARELPRATVVGVPNRGHSELSQERCALGALRRFLGDERVGDPCRRLQPVLDVLPVPPRRLAALRAPRGVPLPAGLTAAALDATFRDLDLLFNLARFEDDEIRFGGLRSGSGRVDFPDDRTVRFTFRRFSFVPGVEVDGTILYGVRARLRSAALRVGGFAAAPGSLSARDGKLVGTVGGAPVELDPPR